MAPVTKNYWRVFASKYRVPQGICCCDSKLYLYIHYNSKWHDTKREPEMQDSTSLFSSGFNRRTLNVRSCSGEVTNFSTNHMHDDRSVSSPWSRWNAGISIQRGKTFPDLNIPQTVFHWGFETAGHYFLSHSDACTSYFMHIFYTWIFHIIKQVLTLEKPEPV